MFGAIKGYFFGGSQNNETSNSSKEKKPLKSDISNNNLDPNKNELKKKTIIKGEKNKFDFSEEYDEDEPKQSPSTSPNLSSKENNLVDYSLILKINDNEYWRMAHSLFVKNSLVNINSFNYVPFIKLKKKQEGLLSYIGFGGSDTSFEEVKYLACFDEHFIYMINLSKEENKDEKNEKKIVGNHYDITKISNIEITEDNTRILVTILFVLDNDVDNFVSKIKKFYLEKQNAFKFLSMLKAYLNNYKIKVAYTDKVFKNINFNEIPKEEDINDKKEVNDDGDDNNNDKVKENNNQKNDEEENLEEEKKEKEPKNEEKEDEIFTDENVEDKDDVIHMSVVLDVGRKNGATEDLLVLQFLKFLLRELPRLD